MINKVINYYKAREKIVDGFIKNSQYLYPGKYTFDETLNYIYLKNNDIAQKSSDMFDNGYLILTYKRSLPRYVITSFLKVIFSRKLNVKKKEVKKDVNFIGTVYLPAGNGKDVKVFDLTNNKIVLIFAEEKEYYDKVYNYKYFNEYFPMPSILSQDDENLFIMEECIDYKTNNEWNQEDFSYVMKDILNRTIKYFKTISNKSDYTLKTPAKILKDITKEDRMINFIKDNISIEIMNLSFPFMKLHGDMWTSNILINNKNNEIYYIDFEHSKELVLFYDIVFIMWSEVIHNKNYIYIEEFISGVYDEYFKEIFKLFDMNFEEKYKLDYLNIFFLVQFKERWIHLSEVVRESIFAQYKSLMNNIVKIKRSYKDVENKIKSKDTAL